MATVFALADCNSFYAACEEVFSPQLKDKPVVILSNNDGCIIARSKAAKALGIKMGEPLFQARDLIEQHQVQVYSSNYSLYGDMSARVMASLAEVTPSMEVYSIDECFLDLAGFSQIDLTHYCQRIQAKVKQYTGISLSLGIGSTKTLSKIANRIAKQGSVYHGVFNLMTVEPEPVLARIAVEEVWGVGRRYAKALREQRIETALQLRDAPQGWIKQQFGVVLLRTVLELQGFSCLPLELCPDSKKGITVSRSFGQPIKSLVELKQAVSTYVSRAGEKLRRETLAATVLRVFVVTNRFKDIPQYTNSVSITLPVATDDTAELIDYALRGTETVYRSGYQFKKAGVMLLGLVPLTLVQANLFDTRDRDRYRRLMQTIDQINRQMGARTIQFAATGLQKRWAMRRAHRSPKYTTTWSDLPIVKA